MRNCARLERGSTKKVGKRTWWERTRWVEGGQRSGLSHPKPTFSFKRFSTTASLSSPQRRWGWNANEVSPVKNSGGEGKRKKATFVVSRFDWAGWCRAVQSLSDLLSQYAPGLEILESSWQNRQSAYNGGELHRSMKYIGQGETGRRNAPWITQASLECDWRPLKGWVEKGRGLGVGGWWGQLCTAGCCSAVEWEMLVGGGGGTSAERRGGGGDYVTVLQTYAWWCEETPDELEKVKRAERGPKGCWENDKSGEKWDSPICFFSPNINMLHEHPAGLHEARLHVCVFEHDWVNWTMSPNQAAHHWLNVFISSQWFLPPLCS